MTPKIQENQIYHFQGDTNYTFKVISVNKEKVSIISEDQIFATTLKEMYQSLSLGALKLL